MAGAQIDQFQFGETTMDAFITVLNGDLYGWSHLTFDAFFTTAAPTKINAGWSLELGGAVYYSALVEMISGAIADGANYIRAGVSGGNMTFAFSTTAPAWDASKRGWYNGDYRYIGRLYKNGATYTNKVLLTGE